MSVTFGLQAGDEDPEGEIPGGPGSIWCQIDVSTIWRKLAGAYAADEGWLRTDLNVINIRDFGAKCDGSDDTQAWVDAITAAHAIHGVVFHPGGVSGIVSGLAPPANSSIQFWGGPNAVIKALAEFPSNGTMLKISSNAGTAGSRYGAVRDLRFDGDDIAAVGLEVFAVQREFQNITINRCNRTGLYVKSAQNCTFISINAEDYGKTSTSPFPDCNICLDNGAANNVFLRCQLSFGADTPSGRGVYNLVICQTNPAYVIPEPFANTFCGCQFERVSTTTQGSILQSAGRINVLDSCTLAITGTLPLIRINNSNGVDSNSLSILNCRCSGTSGQTTGVRADTLGVAATVANCLFENVVTLFVVSDDCSIDLAGPLYHGATNLVTPLGSDTAPGLVTQKMLRIDGLPAGAGSVPGTYNFQTSVIYDGTHRAMHLLQSSALGWHSVKALSPNPSLLTTTGGAAVSIDTAGFRFVTVRADNNSAFTINAPTNGLHQESLTVQVYNNTGGAMGAITWNAVFKLAGAFTNPAAGMRRMITYLFDGTNWREISRTAADQ